ncbi:MAG: dihydropteroate synthase [Syntrophomonas sp.]|nr:dihydropteroate synthase [Syntrophomonas sp.]
MNTSNTPLSAAKEFDRVFRLAHSRSMELGKKTLIMGILNVTPDSFSDGGRFFNHRDAIEHALQMVSDGADIIDVGGASSRPGGVIADEQEELHRVLPIVKELAAQGIIISVDTFRARVAQETLALGAHLINDIGSLAMDPELLDVIIQWQAPVVIMHNRLQLNPGEGYINLIADIIRDLERSITRAVAAGLDEDRIIIDPGLGFGKNEGQNRLLLKRLQEFKNLGKPILIGASRKKFIGSTLNLELDQRLEGSLAVAAIAIMNGADIIRVHDVRESVRVARMTDAVRRENG